MEKEKRLDEISLELRELKKRISTLEEEEKSIKENLLKADLESFDIDIPLDTEEARILFERIICDGSIYENIYGSGRLAFFKPECFIYESPEFPIRIYGQIIKFENHLDPYERMDDGRVDFDMKMKDDFEIELKGTENKLKTVKDLVNFFQGSYRKVNSNGWSKFNEKVVLDYIKRNIDLLKEDEYE